MKQRDLVALIGGSGAHQIVRDKAQQLKRLGPVPTPFGLSAPLYRARMESARFLFLPRHGESGYDVAAPWVNYRANIYALKEHGVERVIAWSGPGAIDISLSVGDYVLPHDLIDETKGREYSFYKGTGLGFIRQHPVFCPELHDAAVIAFSRLNLPFREQGLYLCTEGPRLETPAEIRRYRDWKATLVGMTLVPEAFLARELEMCYLPICYVSNYAEGIKESPVRPGELFEGLLEQTETELVDQAVARLTSIASTLSRSLQEERTCPCALAMERYRREGRIGQDWHTWIGQA
jgi:5'-methylthioadenosine phosphorylase